MINYIYYITLVRLRKEICRFEDIKEKSTARVTFFTLTAFLSVFVQSWENLEPHSEERVAKMGVQPCIQPVHLVKKVKPADKHLLSRQ